MTELVCDGKTSPEIGALLGISGQTVKNHLENIYFKLGLNSRELLVRWAIAEGYVKA